jgi:hypothetical protein
VGVWPSRRIAVVGAIAAMASFCAPSQPQSTPSTKPTPSGPSFVLAVGGWQGGLEPIARFTDDVWRNDWPAADESSVPVPTLDDVPASWLAKPVPRQWTVWKDGRPYPVRVIGTRRGDGTHRGDGTPGGCTYPAMLVLEIPGDVPKDLYDGELAVDTDQPIPALQHLEPSEPDWSELRKVADQAFRVNEGRVMDGVRHSWHDWKLAEAKVSLKSFAVKVDSLWRVTAVDGSPWYYFLASRRAEIPGDRLGLAEWGWLRRNAQGQWVSVGVAGTMLGGDGPGAGLIPFGVVPVGARMFWVMVRPQYESSRFEIYDVAATDVKMVLAAGGGGC